MRARRSAAVLAAGALLPLALTACVTPVEPPIAPLPEGCDAAAAQRYVGRIADAATVEAARRDAGAAIVRTLAPGQIVTMEYRGDRLNLHIDGKRRITRVGCN